MRRLLPHASFALIGLLLLHGLAHVATTVSPDAEARNLQLQRWQVQRATADGAEITAITLGNSHNRAIDFNALDEGGLHLWRSGGDLLEAVHIAHALVPELPALRRIYVSISFGGFDVDNTNTGRATRRRQMYAVLPHRGWIPGDVSNYAMSSVLRVVPVEAVVRSDHWVGVVRAIVRGAQPEEPWVMDRFGMLSSPGYQDCHHLSAVAVGQHAVTRVSHHLGVMGTSQAANPGLERRVEAQLRDLIAEAADRGVEVVLYTPPYTAAYTAEVPNSMRTHARNVATRIAATTDAQYVDWSTDPRFVEQPELFMNSDHMNRCGAEEFSTALRETLQ